MLAFRPVSGRGLVVGFAAAYTANKVVVVVARHYRSTFEEALIGCTGHQATPGRDGFLHEKRGRQRSIEVPGYVLPSAFSMVTKRDRIQQNTLFFTENDVWRTDCA
ncbi:hypothetical protein NDU88_004532 [Pleurodeles waltl]|uniref:Secreted protein n=1 Tax=Pleurodeles waltl TaxID=8319 RepID=A0AAV7UFA7_PLEWA|nr:hypothetical protein NDU88_004532 [Pleurodeles waltl]